MASGLLTMQDLFRDTVFGRLLRRITGGRLFGHDDQAHILALGKKYHHHSVQSSTSILPLDDKSTPSAETPGGNQERPNPTNVEKGGDNLLVEWSHNDPHNPRNWSSFKKVFVNFEICFLTVSVYIGSAIYTAGLPGIQHEFQISAVKSLLGLTLFVLGYALGPMILVHPFSLLT